MPNLNGAVDIERFGVEDTRRMEIDDFIGSVFPKYGVGGVNVRAGRSATDNGNAIGSKSKCVCESRPQHRVHGGTPASNSNASRKSGRD